MKALLLVDIQNDFTPGTPGGALAVPHGDEVIAVANRLMPSYGFVVATRDWHPAEHGSFASQHPGHAVGDVIDLHGLDQVLWPDHCVRGTAGAELCDALNTDLIDEVLRKGTDPKIDSYSGFHDNGPPHTRQATGLTELLRGRGVTAVDVMGLATDYCVKFTALDAVREGFDTRVILDGCRGVELNAGDCERAIEAMHNGGAEILDKASKGNR